MGPIDVALEEFKALRTEIGAHQQAQTTVVNIALVATATIGGIAFGSGASDEKERLEILLVLPIVLCGLGLTYLNHSHGAQLIGSYIRDKLWKVLQGAGYRHSWEVEVSRKLRGGLWAAVKPAGWLRWLPGLLIFGVPSVASLVLNREKAPEWVLPGAEGGSELSAIWALDALALVASFILLGAVWLRDRGFSSESGDDDDPDRDDEGAHQGSRRRESPRDS